MVHKAGGMSGKAGEVVIVLLLLSAKPWPNYNF
jgi:hypothetical protein